MSFRKPTFIDRIPGETTVLGGHKETEYFRLSRGTTSRGVNAWLMLGMVRCWLMSPFSHISWESNRRTQSKVLGTKEKGKCYHQRIIMQIIIHLHFCLSLQAADVLRVVFMLLCFISQHCWNELKSYNGFLFLMYDFYFFFFHFSFFRLMVICYLDLFMWSSWYTVLLLTLLMVWDLMKKDWVQ